MTKLDSLGDKLKEIEGAEAGRKARTGMPLMARLDGRGFHNFTKGLERPFHQGLSDLMIETTKHLVDEFQAEVGYCQSDEITLSWYRTSNDQSDYDFNGRYQKYCSLLAASASVYFNKNLVHHIPVKQHLSPMFDCRVWSALDLHEAYLNFLWREQDATKNAITMAASAYYPHKELHGVNGVNKQEMLFQKGINFNDYPAFFKRGTYVARRTVVKEMDIHTLSKIPEKHRMTGMFERSIVQVLDVPPISKVENAIGVLFHGQTPSMRQE